MNKRNLFELWYARPGPANYKIAKLLLTHYGDDHSVIDAIAESAARDASGRFADKIARKLPPLDPSRLTAKRFGEIFVRHGSPKDMRSRKDVSLRDRRKPENFEIKGNWLRLGGEVPLDTEATFLDLSSSRDVLHLLAAARFPALKTILLNQRSEVADLAPLADLKSLRILWLNRTNVENLAPLEKLTELRVLRLNDTLVSDLAPITQLKRLQVLSLNQTRSADLSPLADIKELKTLRLNLTKVRDLSPLVGLSSLKTLHLAQTRISDISPLAAITALETLRLDGANVEDLAPLARLPALKTLHLRNAKATDLSPLISLADLRVLRIDGAHIKDLSPLVELPALQKLYLSYEQLSDLSPFRKHISAELYVSRDLNCYTSERLVR